MIAGPSFIIAASSLFAATFGAPITRSDTKAARSLVERSAYQVFSGDGSTAQGWPAESSWLDFESLWTANLPVISVSCAEFNVPDNSKDETASIKKGLIAVSKESGVSSTYLLAIMMQESKGCVRAPTTNNGIRNPGLFQDHNGVATCNDETVINPCPEATITQMISEGAGIGMEVGVSSSISDAGASDVSKYYKAARIYNSGSIDTSGNLGAGIATHCYCSDIANRLIGWTTARSSCNENTIGTMTGGATYTPVASSAPSASVAPVASSTPSATVTPPQPTYEPTAADPVPSEIAAPAVVSATSSKYPGASANCKSWYDVKAGDDCMSTGVDMATLTKLNPGLDSSCSNLWLGSSYCIAA